MLVAGLVVALLVAGVASHYASSHPDGLERVARSAGFDATAQESPAADGPLAGYAAEGVEDARLSGGLAGVAGTLLVLLLAGGLFRVVRRRTPAGSTPDGEG